MQEKLWGGKTLEECKKCSHHRGMDGSLVICSNCNGYTGMIPAMPRSGDAVISVDCQYKGE